MINALPPNMPAGEHMFSRSGYGSDDFEPPTSWSPNEAEHAVQFYESDTYLLERLGEFVAGGLAAGDACIVAVTPAHRAELDRRLEAAGQDVVLARASGQYVALDAAETLAMFMIDGSPDAERFAGVIGALIAQASRGRQRVRIFGEMVAVLWAEGQYDAALRLEALWDELHAAHEFILYCAYPMQQFGTEAMREPFADVCAAHRRVIPAESYSSLVDRDERLRAIVKLQQQARSLENAIDRRKQLEHEREQLLLRERAARIQAQEAVRVRDIFLSIAAHELRTPVTSLLGNAQLLQRRLERAGDAAGGLNLVRAIAYQSKRLGNLIGGLLDVSRIETGQLNVERAPLDICMLVCRIVDELQPSLDNHTLDCRQPGYALMVDGDELRLEQVLQNLLANAVKYSPDGGTIVVQVEQHDRQVCLLVTDCGIGIPEHEQFRLFQRFFRASNADERLLSGMGIGLYVVNEIVTLHGGTVAVASREGQGSTFSVSLPLID